MGTVLQFWIYINAISTSSFFVRCKWKWCVADAPNQYALAIGSNALNVVSHRDDKHANICIVDFQNNYRSTLFTVWRLWDEQCINLSLNISVVLHILHSNVPPISDANNTKLFVSFQSYEAKAYRPPVTTKMSVSKNSLIVSFQKIRKKDLIFLFVFVS